MSPCPFVITINTRLSFFFSHLCPPLVFLFTGRTRPILRGQSSVRLRNIIIMPSSSASARTSAFWQQREDSSRHDLFNYIRHYIPYKLLVKYELIMFFFCLCSFVWIITQKNTSKNIELAYQHYFGEFE